MGKYDPQIGQFRDKLVASKKVLIALPQTLTIDRLSAGLALMLSLKHAGKDVTVAAAGSPLVAHSNIYGIGEVKNSLPEVGSGNFVVSLEGVAENVNGTPQITTLEKLDYYPEGNNLNLVFYTLPGKTFKPTNINSFYRSSNFDLIFVIGASNLNDLGAIYTQNSDLYAQVQTVNIDNSPTNASFGAVNLYDNTAGSLSEIIMQILTTLNLNIDNDIASNILAGIYEATANMSIKTTAETFIAVGQAMQVGGKVVQSEPQAAPQVVPQVLAQPVATPAPEATAQPQVASQVPSTDNNNGFDLRQVFNLPQDSANSSPGLNPTGQSIDNTQNVPSPEERPMGEQASSPIESESSPTPDWLVPKIYKGGSTS